MSGVSSKRKCKRCKEKQLKCDATHPKCDRCGSAGVDCPGYIQDKFVDESATLRRRYSSLRSSVSRHGKRARNGKNISSNQKNGFISWRIGSGNNSGPKPMSSELNTAQARANSSLQSDIPEPQTAQQEEMIHYTDAIDKSILEHERPRTTQRVTRQAPWSADYDSDHLANSLEEGSGVAQSHMQCAGFPKFSTRGTPMIENCGTSNDRESTECNLPISPGLTSQQSERDSYGDIYSEFITGNGKEIQVLLRHYSDVIGPWLDLSDVEGFFSVHVGIRANDDLTLKYAMAAISAKQLGRVKNLIHSGRNRSSTQFVDMSRGANCAQVDWSLRAANYYKLATAELGQSTSLDHSVPGSSIDMSPINVVHQWIRNNLGHHSFSIDKSSRGSAILRKTEDLLAAVVLLTSYELIDKDGEEWFQHSSGMGSLFETIQKLHTDPDQFFSLGIRAAFWNLIRQDLFGAYFRRSATNIDPENLALWRSAGINIDNEGHLQLVPLREGGMNLSDQAANGGLWLVFKIVNFLAKQKQAQLARWIGSPSLSLDGQDTNLNPFPDPAVWLRLCFELQAWLESLPETFRPSLRTELPKDSSRLIDGKFIPEIFYGRPACAAAIQHYHFGRIALLLNQPTDPINSLSTSFDRLRGYREVSREVEFHSREICGIALGRPPDAVRIFMIPILFAVGQCLENPDEHVLITKLLRSVEEDLGWATDSTIQKLQASWSRWHNK